MKPRDWFNLLIKAAGLFILLRGLECLLQALILVVNGGTPEASGRYWGILGIAEVFFGLLVIRLDTPLLDWAFPDAVGAPPVRPTEPPAQPPAAENAPRCGSCEAAIPVGAKFCPDCGWKQPG